MSEQPTTAAGRRAWTMEDDGPNFHEAGCDLNIPDGVICDCALPAALAELVRDLITPAQYHLLISPWREVIGA